MFEKIEGYTYNVQDLDLLKSTRVLNVEVGDYRVLSNMEGIAMRKSLRVADEYIRLKKSGNPPKIASPKIEQPKAKKTSALPAGSRWITVHPNGSGDKGTPLLIQEGEGKGTAHVIAGAGGKLNGLKLNKIKSKEEYSKIADQRKEDKKTKQAEEKLKKQQEKAAMTPEARKETKLNEKAAKQALKDKEKEKKDKKAKAIDKYNNFMMTKMGWDSEDIEFEFKESIEQLRGQLELYDSGSIELKMLEKEIHNTEKAKERAIASQRGNFQSAGNDVIKQIKRGLIADKEMRGLVEEKVGESVDSSDVIKTENKSKGKGFLTGYKDTAEEKGLDKESLAKEKKDLFDARMEEIAEENPALALMIKGGIETNKAINAIKRKTYEREDLDVKSVGEAEDQAEILMQYLELQATLKSLEEDDAKQIDLDGNVEPEQVEEKEDNPVYGNAVKLDFTELLEQDLSKEEDRIKTERQAAIHSSLLDAIENNPGGSEKWIANGNFAGFNSIALAALKDEGLDRDLVDILGIGASAQILAMTARASLSEEDYKDFAQGMAKYHEEVNESLAKDAMDEVKELLEKADGIKVQIDADPEDINVLEELNEDRLVLLDEANRIAGQTLGSLEASAAMVLELKKTKDPETIEVSLGSISNEDAIIRLRAIGCEKGDYDIQSIGDGQKVAIIKSPEKLIRPVSAEDIRIENEVNAIKAGLRDEPGWLPAGLVDRNALDYEDPGADKTIPEGDIDNQSLGDDAKSIKLTEEAAHRALGELPEGAFAYKDVGDLSPAEQTDLRRYWEKSIYQGSMAESSSGQNYLTDVKGISKNSAWQKYLKGENAGIENAAMENIKADIINNHSSEDMFGEKDIPKLGRVSAGDYSTYRHNVDGAGALFDEIDSLRDPALVTDAKEAEKEIKKLEASLPEKLDEMYKSQMKDHYLKNMAGYTEEQYTAGETRKEKSPWGEYVRMHGDVTKAQESVMDTIKGDYNDRFLNHYSKITGIAPKTKKEAIRNSEDHNLGMIHKDARDSYTERFKKEMGEAGGALANRSRGKFTTGSWKDKFKEYAAEKKAEEAKQVDLFADPADLVQEDGSAVTRLGKRAEGQLASMMPNLSQNQLRGQKFKVNTMTAAGVRERAIKMFQASKRMNLSFGTGKGKTIISIGAFTDLKAQGKAKRAIFAVPSVVLSQFGNEVNTFCEPGKYKVKSDPTLNRTQRIEAMKSGDTDMCIFTHQSLRDDLVHLMAKNKGVEVDEMKKQFNAMPEKERKTFLGDTMKKEGIAFDMMTVDEAHYITNRAGKPDTTLSNVMDALNQNCEYYMAQTATPVKNDASEAFDMLHKVAPDKFQDRDEFLKKYGVDTGFNKNALRRLVNRYNYASPSLTGVKRNTNKDIVTLEGNQKAAYEKVGEMFQRASRANRAGKVDVEAMKYLSPNSFANKPESEHEALAEKLQLASGTIKEEALNRVVNQHDWKENGKIKKTMDIIAGKVYSEANAKTNSKAGGQKPGVIFAHNIKTVENLKASMESKGMRVGVIQGTMNGKDKEKVKVGFNPPNPKDRIYDVILCSDAGATGLNLQNAGYLINYDLPQTAWVKTQREGRIDRMGQAHEEIDYHDIVSDTEHESIKWDRIQRKKALGSIFEEDPGSLDDSGLASHIANVRQERQNNGS